MGHGNGRCSMKTVEILPETSGAVLCLRLTGTVTAEDYLTFFDAPLKAIVDKYGHYSLYVDYDPGFEGWSPEAADLSFKCIAECGPKARRCAYVNPPQGRFLMMKLLDPLLTAEVRYFNENQKSEALSWVLQN